MKRVKSQTGATRNISPPSPPPHIIFWSSLNINVSYVLLRNTLLMLFKNTLFLKNFHTYFLNLKIKRILYNIFWQIFKNTTNTLFHSQVNTHVTYCNKFNTFLRQIFKFLTNCIFKFCLAKRKHTWSMILKKKHKTAS